MLHSEWAARLMQKRASFSQLAKGAGQALHRRAPGPQRRFKAGEMAGVRNGLYASTFTNPYLACPIPAPWCDVQTLPKKVNWG